MTSVLTDLARQYRARAEEARERASAAVTEEGRQSLLRIAESWERMAKWEAQPYPQRTSGESLKPAKSN
jgi:DNA-binding PadR family transcriptional regulator